MASYAKFMDTYSYQIEVLSGKHRKPWAEVREQLIEERLSYTSPTEVELHIRRLRNIMSNILAKEDSSCDDPRLLSLIEDLWLASVTSGLSLSYPAGDINVLCTWNMTPHGSDMWSKLHALE